MTDTPTHAPTAPVARGRREFLRKAVVTGAAASLGPFVHPRPARAARSCTLTPTRAWAPSRSTPRPAAPISWA